MTTDRYIHALEEVSGELRLLAGFVDLAGRDAPPEKLRAIKHIAAQLALLSDYATRIATDPAAALPAGPEASSVRAMAVGDSRLPVAPEDASEADAGTQQAPAQVHQGPWRS